MAGPDHYAILGVLPSAEDVVIKAAYKALAQRYHPDKYVGDPSVAATKMAAINAAYGVLSDHAKRAAFDKTRAEGTTQSEEVFDDDRGDAESLSEALRRDWKLALDIYPDLGAIDQRMARTSWALALAYKTALLHRKCFDVRSSLASSMETQFLARYFGNNRDAVSLARDLIRDGHRPALRELNKIAVVLGDSLEHDAAVAALRRKMLLPRNYITTRESNQRLSAALKDVPISGNYVPFGKEFRSLIKSLLKITVVLVIIALIAQSIYKWAQFKS
jgi:curved DNA-binding protein CbpA